MPRPQVTPKAYPPITKRYAQMTGDEQKAIDTLVENDSNELAERWQNIRLSNPSKNPQSTISMTDWLIAKEQHSVDEAALEKYQEDLGMIEPKKRVDIPQSFS